MSGEPAAAGAAERARAPRRRRRALVALAVVAALGIAVRAALPWAIARTLESQASRQLGLPVRVANVDLWLARGAVALEGLVVGRWSDAQRDPAAPPAPDTALLRLSRLFVDLDWGGLFGHRVQLSELALEGPKLRVERDAEGRIEPLGPPAAAPEPAAEPEAAEAAEPWGFAVDRFDLRGLELALADLATQRTPVEFALARLALTDVAVAASDLGLGGVEIENPVLRIDRDFAMGQRQGGEAAGAAAPPAEGAEEAAALAYQIERIGIADADFTLRTDAGPIDVSIGLSAEKVNARSGESFPLDISLGIGDGKLALTGQLGLNPLAYDGRVALSNLALPPLGVAARPELAAWLRSCRADGDFSVRLRSTRSADGGPGLRVAGATTLRELLFADPSNEEVSIGWKELEVVVREAFVPLAVEGKAPSATRVSLERIRLVEPDLLYTRPAPALDALLGAGAEPPPAGEAPAEAPPAEPEAAPLELALDAFDLTGGRLRFRDATLSPPVETVLRDLGVEVREAGLPERHARSLRARGIVAEAAPISLDGSLEQGSGELHLTLERLELSHFDPYAEASGYSLASGQASIATKLRLRGTRSDVDSRLVLHRLDVSSRDPGAFERQFGIPLDVALALLRDPRGEIRLAIPVVVDESGARTGLATIVQGALRQALVGALSSPLKLVGAVLPTGGRGEATFEPLEAVPGQAALAPGAEERLAGLARLLADRPMLALRLRGRAAPADRPLLAEQILVERATADESLPKVEGAGFLARRRIAQALVATGRGEQVELSPEDRGLLERMVASVEVPPERLRDLAQRRADAARDALAAQHGVDPRRLPRGDPAEPGAPAVALELAVATSAP